MWCKRVSEGFDCDNKVMLIAKMTRFCDTFDGRMAMRFELAVIWLGKWAFCVSLVVSRQLAV